MHHVNRGIDAFEVDLITEIQTQRATCYGVSVTSLNVNEACKLTLQSFHLLFLVVPLAGICRTSHAHHLQLSYFV